MVVELLARPSAGNARRRDRGLWTVCARAAPPLAGSAEVGSWRLEVGTPRFQPSTSNFRRQWAKQRAIPRQAGGPPGCVIPSRV